MPFQIGDFGHVAEHNTLANSILGKVNSADMPGILESLVPGVVVDKVDKGELFVRPEDFGTIGVGNDTAVLQACFNSVVAGGVHRVVMLTGNYTLTDTLNWDPARVSVTGSWQFISAINDAAKAMVRTGNTSDPSDIASPVRHRATIWEGGVLLGDGVTGGFRFEGNNNSEKPAHISIRNTTVTKCGTAVYFGLNAYMINFVQCNISLSRIGIRHDDAANSGERLEFIGCDITGHGRAIELNSGQALHFTNCSFSYILRQIAYVLTGQVYFTQCHMEFSAPYVPYIEVAGGTVFATDCRWLIRDQALTSNAVLTLPAGDLVGWVTNERGRFTDGDPVRFTSLTGVTGIDTATTYYIRDITDSGFRVALTPGGAAVSWTGTGTGTGPNGFGGAAIFGMNSTAAVATVRGGHVSGSSLDTTLWSSGAGAANFAIENTATFGSVALVMHNRLEGDLRDPGFAATAAFDDWDTTSAAAVITYDAADKVLGTKSLLVTRASTGTVTLRLHVPIKRASRMLLSYSYKKNSGGGCFHAGYYVTKRAGNKGATLWSSTLSVNAAWTAYSQKGKFYAPSPPWAEFLLLEWDLANLAVGETLRIDYPQISLA